MAIRHTRVVSTLLAASLLTALSGCTLFADTSDSSDDTTTETTASSEPIAIPDPSAQTIATAVFQLDEGSSTTLAPAEGDVRYEVIRQCSSIRPDAEFTYHVLVSGEEVVSGTSACDGSIAVDSFEPFADGAEVSVTLDVPEGTTAAYAYVDPSQVE